MFKKLILKLYLTFRGIRFYETDTMPKSQEIRKVIFELIDDRQVEFYFYRETFVDLIYKAGAIKEVEFVGYMVRANFHEDVPEKLMKYNNMKFVFLANDYLLDDEQLICETLLGIYLDLIKTQLSKDA